MKKQISVCSLIFLFAFAGLAFTGCSDTDTYTARLRYAVQEQFNRKMLDTSEISLDEDYERYVNLREEDKLSPEGYYTGEDLLAEGYGEMPETEGKVHVTFAENAFLETAYFYDAALTEPIDTSMCYLEPETCIYASEPVVTDTAGNAYEFSDFRVWKYNSEGERDGEIHTEITEENLVIKIPSDSSVTDISIEPVGKYRERVLSLKDYYMDENGNPQELTGTWFVNGKAYTEETVTVSAAVPCTVQYQYDVQKYFFVTSSPECFSHNPTGGKVHFTETEASGKNDSYSVELRPCIDAVIETDGWKLVTVKVDGVEQTLPYTFRKLKSGDTITIETSSSYKLICDDTELPEPEILPDSCRYTFRVPEDVTSLRFKVREWTSKTIPVNIPASDIWDKLTGLFSPDTAEDSLLQVKIGEDIFTYKELKYRMNLTMRETQQLEVFVTDEIRNYPELVFAVSVNGASPVYLSMHSEQKSLTYQYGEVDSIKISAASKDTVLPDSDTSTADDSTDTKKTNSLQDDRCT